MFLQCIDLYVVVRVQQLHACNNLRLATMHDYYPLYNYNLYLPFVPLLPKHNNQ